MCVDTKGKVLSYYHGHPAGMNPSVMCHTLDINRKITIHWFSKASDMLRQLDLICLI
jgi:hypothetical protein